MNKQNKVNPAIMALIIIVVLGAATTAAALINDTSKSTSKPLSFTSPQDSKSAKKNSYKDGTYSSQGSYLTPGGRESIGVSVTLKNNVIENAELNQQASGGDTVIYQRKFASGYKAEVVGKNIDDVKLSRVAGSSLTSNGFNDALEQIKTDATL